MKIETLLKRAALCKTDKDAQALLETLKTAFSATKLFADLHEANDEAYFELEYAAPFVRYQLSNVISDDYIIEIQPEFRDGKFCVYIAMNRMLDGLGMSSQSWELVEGMEDELQPYPAETVLSIAKRAKEIALLYNQRLIEQVGVPEKVAKLAAKKSWRAL